jgi:hypothetical protein
MLYKSSGKKIAHVPAKKLMLDNFTIIFSGSVDVG